MNNMIIFGGTFDPVHHGHLSVATTVQNHFHFDRFFFLPCKQPVLKKEPQTTTDHRLEMLNLALANYPDTDHFLLDSREIKRQTPSYTLLSLKSYREELGFEIPICLLLGMDSFLQLPSWYCWQELLSYCHFIVLRRDSSCQQPSLNPILTQAVTSNEDILKEKASGSIYFFDAGYYPISSSLIREKVRSQQNITHLVPEAVRQYIYDHHLYEL